MTKVRLLALTIGLLTLPARPAPCADQHAREVTLTFVGDIMLDGGPGHLITNDGDPFAHVTEILLSSDMTVGNLEYAHRLLDAGADGIVGTHPHVTQTIEWYQDKPIVYSFGNFVFD